MKAARKKVFVDDEAADVEELDVPIVTWTLDELGDIDDLSCLSAGRPGGDDAYA